MFTDREITNEFNLTFTREFKRLTAYDRMTLEEQDEQDGHMSFFAMIAAEPFSAYWRRCAEQEIPDHVMVLIAQAYAAGYCEGFFCLNEKPMEVTDLEDF